MSEAIQGTELPSTTALRLVLWAYCYSRDWDALELGFSGEFPPHPKHRSRPPIADKRTFIFGWTEIRNRLFREEMPGLRQHHRQNRPVRTRMTGGVGAGS